MKLYYNIQVSSPKEGWTAMSSRRNHYSSTPLMRMDKHKAPEPQSYEPPVIEDETYEKPKQHRLLQLILLLLLPAFLVVAIVLNRPMIYAAYLGVCLVVVVIMWLVRAFTQNARGKLSLFYAVSALAVVALIIINTPGPVTTITVSRVDSNAVFSQDNVLDTPSLTDIQQAAAAALQQNETPTEEPQETEIPISAAQSRLDEFMQYWAVSDRENQLAMCVPSWVDSQENPGSSLFNILGFTTPTSYMVERVYGTNTDNSRPIQIIANISNQDGSTSSKRYQVMMVRSNDTWYVDPSSLNSIGMVTEENQVFEQRSALYDNMTPSPSPEPTTNPGLLLYYNTGGQYYHLDPNCSRIASEYLPLSTYFTYAELDDPKYRTLNPCKTCHAPKRYKDVY